MDPIYKRQKANITYFSLTAVDPDADLQTKLTVLKKNLEHGFMTQDEVDEKTAALNAAPDDVETVAANFDQLTAISDRYGLLTPLGTATRNAQIAMAVAMLNEKVSDVDAHVDQIKKATGEPWKIIRNWCDEPAQWGETKGKDGKTKKVLQPKTGTVRVPSDVIRALDAKVADQKKVGAAS